MAGAGRSAAKQRGDTDTGDHAGHRLAPAGWWQVARIPGGMPPWRTVHGWFGRWLALGLFDRMMRATWRACAAVPRGGGQSLDWQSSAPRRWKCLPVRGPRGLRMAILDGAFTAGRRCEWSHLHGTRHEVVARLPDQRGFAVLPPRWVAERSFGWLTRWGSLLRDRAGRLDVAADCTAVLAATETPVNPA